MPIQLFVAEHSISGGCDEDNIKSTFKNGKMRFNGILCLESQLLGMKCELLK
jgi:hypothetical protein